MKHPKEKGIITEYKVISKILELGYRISKPVGDNFPYDIILDIDGTLLRIQIKTGRYRNGCIIFNTASYASNMNNVYAKHYTGKIDYFISYCDKLNIFVMLPIDISTKYTKNLRVDTPKNGQLEGITWAKDYLLEDVLMSIKKRNRLMNGG